MKTGAKTPYGCYLNSSGWRSIKIDSKAIRKAIGQATLEGERFFSINCLDAKKRHLRDLDDEDAA